MYFWYSKNMVFEPVPFADLTKDEKSAVLRGIAEDERGETVSVNEAS